jgi:hypothetical protein
MTRQEAIDAITSNWDAAQNEFGGGADSDEVSDRGLAEALAALGVRPDEMPEHLRRHAPTPP